MQSKATAVEDYLAELPADRREAIETVRKVILKNLDKKYQECIQYGVIGYVLPLSVYPKGYHCTPNTPLPFAGLASQKNYMSFYLPFVYCGCGLDDPSSEHADWLREEWAKTGKKLDMGKSCIRFRKLEDLPLDVIGKAIKRVPVKMYIQYVEDSLARTEATRQ